MQNVNLEEQTTDFRIDLDLVKRLSFLLTQNQLGNKLNFTLIVQQLMIPADKLWRKYVIKKE